MGAISIGGQTEFVGDRLHIHGVRKQNVSVLGSNVSVALTNSLFENASIGWSTFDSQFPGSKLSFAFNTFVLTDYASMNCSPDSNSPFRNIGFENNIILGRNTTPDVIIGGDCSTTSNVLHPQGVRTGNILALPQFIDQEARDFRLLPTSPAVNAASSSLAIDHDFAGAARPQGGAYDIGAFEQ